MTIIVAFQGKHGAYSELACQQYFGEDVETLPCQSFQATFDAIHSQQATHIMLPIENSLAGAVSPAYDLMIDYDLRVQGEEIVKVEHCMMAPAGTKLAEVTRVISHWQALAQCAGTLDRLGIEMVNHADTAGSAKELATTLAPNTVALASELSAKLYGLEILARDIQDQPNNYTRFFVLGSGDAKRVPHSKTSIIFTTRNDLEAGALYRVLGALAENNINMTKIESRPRPNVPWHYRFFIDFEGHEDDENVQAAFLRILRLTSFLKILGSYPAKQLNENDK